MSKSEKEEFKLTAKVQSEKFSKSVAIYWGTFDPPTLAHGNIIRESLKKFNFSKLIIVINDNMTTGKIYKSPGIKRLIMTRYMINSLLPEEAKTNRIIIFRQTDVFSLTCEKVKEEFPGYSICPIVGQDSFEKFSKYCFDYDRIIVAPRNDGKDKLLQQIEALKLHNIIVLDIDKQFSEVSSTAIREAVRDDKTPVKIDKTTLEYIQKQGLFKYNYTAKHYLSAEIIQKHWKLKKENTSIKTNDKIPSTVRNSHY